MNPHPKIVGRSTEIAIFTDALQALSKKQGQLLMLCGEAGIGKSTLVHYLASQASKIEIPVYWGFAWEAGGAPSYWPWTQLIRNLVHEENINSGISKQLNQIVPEFGEANDEIINLQPEQALFQLLESVRNLLEQCSKNNPIVLILEDLHAADNDSLQLLLYLAKHIPNMPILMIGTFRDQEVERTNASNPLWLATRDAQLLQIQRLTADNIFQFLIGRSGRPPTTAQVNQLLATTEGNPLFLNELVLLLEQQGSVDEKVLPQTIQQVINRQLQRLPENCLQLLANASVLGREFTLDSLAELSGQTLTALDQLISPALTAGVIVPASSNCIRFFHVLYCDVLHQGLERNHREEMHRHRADLLMKIIAKGSDDHWTELATHLDAAGPAFRTEAINAWQNAARRSSEKLAFDAAASALENAFNAFGNGPHYDPVDRCQLMMELANATMIKGDIERGYQLCRDAFSIAKSLENGPLMARTALTWGSAIMVANVNQELISALEDSLQQLSSKEVGLQARVLARLAAAMQPAPNPEIPIEMARDAIKLARSTNDKQVIYEVLKFSVSAMMP